MPHAAVRADLDEALHVHLHFLAQITLNPALPINDLTYAAHFLLGEVFDAQTAMDWGLLNRVVPRAQLDQVVDGWLDSLLENGPRAVRDQKALMRRWERLPIAPYPEPQSNS